MRDEVAAHKRSGEDGEGTRDAPQRSLSRRQLLQVGIVGGAALVATNAATLLISERLASEAAEKEKTALRAEYAQEVVDTREALQARITRLEQQLVLYQAMDRVGLDRLINLFLDIYDRFWPSVAAGIGLLRQGLRHVADAVGRFEKGLGGLRGAVEVLGGLLDGIDAQLAGVQGVLEGILRRTAPLREAVSGFFTWLINKIPFGVGTQTRQAAEQMTDLAAALPLLLQDTRERLLNPLQAEWLIDEREAGLQGALFVPLSQKLLAPLQAHLDELARMADRWENEFARPLREALAEREAIRGSLNQLEQASRPDVPTRT